MATSLNQATGRRKKAIASVRLQSGTGKIMVNGKTYQEYFSREINRIIMQHPLTVTSTNKVYDIYIRVRGGGETGQADAVKMGIARALVKANDKLKPTLRQFGLLTRDSRMVERKKYGHPKARKRFQFSKR